MRSGTRHTSRRRCSSSIERQAYLEIGTSAAAPSRFERLMQVLRRLTAAEQEPRRAIRSMRERWPRWRTSLVAAGWLHVPSLTHRMVALLLAPPYVSVSGWYRRRRFLRMLTLLRQEIAELTTTPAKSCGACSTSRQAARSSAASCIRCCARRRRRRVKAARPASLTGAAGAGVPVRSRRRRRGPGSAARRLTGARSGATTRPTRTEREHQQREQHRAGDSPHHSAW
jgi:hypothetical protein